MHAWVEIGEISRGVRKGIEWRLADPLPAPQSSRREHPVLRDAPSTVRPHPVLRAGWIGRDRTNIWMVADRLPEAFNDLGLAATGFLDYLRDGFLGYRLERLRFGVGVRLIIIAVWPNRRRSFASRRSASYPLTNLSARASKCASLAR